MASTLSRRFCRSLLSNTGRSNNLSSRCFVTSDSSENTSDLEDVPDTDPISDDLKIPPKQNTYYRPLENGLDDGVYKAILVGQVGQTPVQKKLRSGRIVTLLSVGTGGIRNNRRPLENEEPKDYANRCSIQWHRVSIYPERLGDIAMKNVTPGTTLYLEGNLETKVFADPVTGLVRRIREVAIRQHGRIVFLGEGNNFSNPSGADLKGVGYF